MVLFKFTVIINAFFISLAGYYSLSTNEETTAQIKGIGLGNIVLNILCFSIPFGLNGSLETLVSQAFGISQNNKEPEKFREEMRRQCGHFLNMTRLVCSFFMIFPTLILFLFGHEILITFFKQNAVVSEIAIQYCIICTPGVWAMTQYDATRRFLAAQKHGAISMWTQVLTCSIQALCCYVFIIQFRWGVVGAAISTNVAYIGNLMIQDFVINLKSEAEFKGMWLQWAFSSLDDLGTYFEYGIPNAMIELFTCCALELFVLIAGYGIVKNVSQREDFNSHVVTMNLFGLIYMVPLGLSYTLSALVGNLLAQNKSHIAKKFFHIGYLYGQFLIVVICIIIKVYGHKIFSHYLNSEASISKIERAMPVIFTYFMLQASTCMLNGVIKGLGLQSMAALWTFIGYYLIGLPLAYLLAFRSVDLMDLTGLHFFGSVQGLTGLYLGFIIATTVINLLYGLKLFQLNWKTHPTYMSYIARHNKSIPSFSESYHGLSQQEILFSRSEQIPAIEGRPLPVDCNEPIIEESSEGYNSLDKHTFMQSEMSIQEYTRE